MRKAKYEIRFVNYNGGERTLSRHRKRICAISSYKRHVRRLCKAGQSSTAAQTIVPYAHGEPVSYYDLDQLNGA